MPYVISQNQSSFIPGRSTVDNILVLQETIHSLTHMYGKTGYMVLKLDLEKAYDKLEWPFILETLQVLKIPDHLCSLIAHCISSSSMRLNWNGKKTNTFNSSRGLRQGDPISPYLFVLAIERLSHKIQDLVVAGTWKGLKFGRGSGPIVSHINFADDLVLVAEASPSQAILIREVLDEFCLHSGQKVNLNKSKVFFSKNITRNLAESLSDILDIEETKDLGFYLGAPMLHQRISKQSFSFLIEKMKKKLAGWKASSLSFAGRVTLAQSSLANIPGYVMQTCNIPVSICDEAEKICRNFIWGSTVDQKKCHLVAWKKIYLPKEEGWPWLPEHACVKLVWQLVVNPDKLWVKVIKAKYSCGLNVCPNIVSLKHQCSNIWRAICHVWEDVENNITWRIQNGNDIRFWKDKWIHRKEPLVINHAHIIPVGRINYPVSFYTINNGTGKLSLNYCRKMFV
jgi:mannosylglycoprotein endo-beta-mannosidase